MFLQHMRWTGTIGTVGWLQGEAACNFDLLTWN